MLNSKEAEHQNPGFLAGVGHAGSTGAWALSTCASREVDRGIVQVLVDLEAL